jgi:hypothetical protein
MADRILKIQTPQEFSTAMQTDPVVQNVADDIARRFFEDRSQNEADQSRVRWATLIQLADNRRDGFRCAVRYAFSSGPREWQAVRVPDSLFGFYRVVRIAGLLRSAPAFLFNSHRES